jgi:hypothetical protein
MNNQILNFISFYRPPLRIKATNKNEIMNKSIENNISKITLLTLLTFESWQSYSKR